MRRLSKMKDMVMGFVIGVLLVVVLVYAVVNLSHR